MNVLSKVPSLPPAVSSVLKSVATTALHAAVFSYISNKVSARFEKKRIAEDAKK